MATPVLAYIYLHTNMRSSPRDKIHTYIILSRTSPASMYAQSQPDPNGEEEVKKIRFIN